MATSRAVEAGRAFIRIIADNTNAYRNLRRMERRFQRFGDRIEKIASSIAGAFAGRAAVTGFFNLAQLGGDAQIVERRFQLLFRNISAEAMQSAKSFSDAYQISLLQVQEQFAKVRAVLTPLAVSGGTERQILELTKGTAKIIQDFAVTTGLSVEESQARIVSALTSTGEAVDQYGVNVRQAAINQQLLSMGINKTVREATEEEKTLAKLMIIRESLNSQQVKAADSLGLYNVQVSRLRKNLEGLLAQIGERLLPALTSIATAINRMLMSMTKFFEAHPTLARVIAGVATGGAIIVGILGAVSALAAIAMVLAPALAALAMFPAAAGILAVAGGVGALAVGTAGNMTPTRIGGDTATERMTSAIMTLPSIGAYTPSAMRTPYAGPITAAERAAFGRPEEEVENVAAAAEVGTAGGLSSPVLAQQLAFGGGRGNIQAQQLSTLQEIKEAIDTTNETLSGEGA